MINDIPKDQSYTNKRDTHVTHTLKNNNEDIDPTILYWEERQIDYRKIKLMLEGKYREPRTAWLSLRLPPTIRKLYGQAPEKVKLAARRALESVIISWFLGEPQVKMYELSLAGTPIIFNVNLNLNENNNRAEASSQNQNIVVNQTKLEILIEELSPKIEELTILLKRINQILSTLVSKKDEYNLYPLALRRISEASEKSRQATFIAKRIAETLRVN